MLMKLWAICTSIKSLFPIVAAVLTSGAVFLDFRFDKHRTITVTSQTDYYL